jgi:hypothetical protein
VDRELTSAAAEFTPLTPVSDRVEHGVVVELLGSQGQVRYRTRVKTLPAIIGRGFDCDVLIDDPHVDPRHAELLRGENGHLVLRDLGSVNGIRDRASGARMDSVALSSGGRVRLGSAEIRVFEANHPLPPALPLAADRRLTTRLAPPGRAIAVCAAALVTAAISEYQSSADSDAALPAIQAAIYVTTAVVFWAAAWALATRIVSRGFRFLQHWAWASALMILGVLLTTIGEWMDFLGPSLELGSWMMAIVGLAVLPIGIAGHLEIASNMSSKRRWRAALGIGAIVMGLAIVASIGEEESTWSIDIAGTLKPMPASLIGGQSIDSFMESAEKLKAEVDELAKEPPSANPLD